MAKRSKRKQKQQSRRQRDVYAITNRLVLPSPYKRSEAFDDGRRWKPDKDQVLQSDARPVEYAEKDSTRSQRKYIGYSQGIKFVSAKKTLVCKRRRARRRQLFKMAKVGRGIKGPKERIRNRFSDIICERR